MFNLPLAAALCCGVLALGTYPILLHAQVVKCKDPKTGKVTYTDAGCASNEQSSDIARRQTAEEAAAEQRQAAIARRRVQREIEGLRVRDQQDAVPERQVNTPPAQVQDKTRTVECQRAKRNLEIEQSSITKRSNLIAALVEVETACGIDGLYAV